ncbi:MAG: tRNA lysidine(34) synthetase TilS [Deltaproteobacteria bacterium]|nr:tRNA lysidine(34) synthetase TilS [Deltaproteobacteria bacterium]
MSGPGRLRHKVGQAIASRQLWAPGDTVLVALSGGMDSVALLSLLHDTSDWHGATLLAGVVDHGTRPCSGAEADLAVSLAEGLGVPAHRLDLSLGAGASEALCREGRYAALRSLGAARIATGHHREDQAETALLAMMRGSGTLGLGGMGWRAGDLVRPLLGVGRVELLRWVHHRGLPWVEDPTNADGGNLRSRLRAEVLPALEAVRPGVSALLARSATHAAEDAALLEHLTDELEARLEHPWPREALINAPAPLVRRLLLRHLPQARSSHLDAAMAALARGHGSVLLPGGARLAVGKGRVRVR